MEKEMVGIGYDNHRLAVGELLILGGVEIDSDIGTVAHSDGDALCHSIIDALLGAANLGDIGEHFPDTDLEYLNANSIELLSLTCQLLRNNGYDIVNIDSTVLLESPKLVGFKALMRNNIANACKIDVSKVSVKAKTNEKIGFIGRKDGVASMAVCMIKKI